MSGKSHLLCSVFLGLLLLSQTACVVESQHPLADPATATFDDRLFGEWRMPDGADYYQHYFIGKVRDEVADAPKGLFAIYHVRVNMKEKSIHPGDSPLFGFSCKVGASDFMNLVELKKENDKPRTWGTPKYLLTKYAVEKDKLTVWLFDLPATAKAVESGSLTGKVDYGKDKKVRSVFLSDPTEKLRGFLEKGGEKSLFNEKAKLVLDRVKW